MSLLVMAGLAVLIISLLRLFAPRGSGTAAMCNRPSEASFDKLPETASEAELREFFCSNELVGQHLDRFIEAAGRFTSYGDFDWGLRVYRWSVDGFSVEVWFRELSCISVEIQDGRSAED